MTAHPEAATLTEALEAASAVDVAAIESALDRGFALGPFETVVDAWLMPALRELGEAWATAGSTWRASTRPATR